jgi:hypothetical protein
MAGLNPMDAILAYQAGLGKASQPPTNSLTKSRSPEAVMTKAVK